MNAGDTRTDKLCGQDAGDDGDTRGDENINRCLFGDDFSKLGCDDGGNERADRTAKLIACDADGSGGEKDERRCL